MVRDVVTINLTGIIHGSILDLAERVYPWRQAHEYTINVVAGIMPGTKVGREGLLQFYKV